MQPENITVCSQAVEVKQDIEKRFLLLGKMLMEIRDGRLYFPNWESFDLYLEDKMKFSEATASKLINIYDRFVLEYQIPEERILEAGGWSSIAEILPMVKNKENAELWLEKLSTLPRNAVRAEMTEKRTGVSQANCPHYDDEVYQIKICRKCGEKWRV